MIFQQYRGHLLVVRQPDHGVQTGLFASHWGNEETPPFTPREPVIAAGTRHDDGWKAWEEAHPTLDPSTGHPWQFYTLTPHEGFVKLLGTIGTAGNSRRSCLRT
jgi:hypothetical protein